MTETEMKEMLKDIIDNDAEYEYTYKDFTGDYAPWQPYKLGYEIRFNWKYRKVEKWYVVKEINQTFTICDYEKAIRYNPFYFEGTKEDCEKWIEEHTKKTWYGDYLKLFPKESQKETCRIVCKEICKKILNEVRKNEGIEQMTKFYIGEIIKDLGVEVWH